MRGRIEVARKNLQLAFAETLSAERRERIIRGSLGNFAYWFADFMTYGSLSASEVERRVEIPHESRAAIDSAIHTGRGIIFLVTHFANWELLGIQLGYDPRLRGAVVAKQMHNSAIDRWINRIRCSSGNELIYARQANMKILRALRDGMAVAIVFDQDTTIERGGVYSKFLGQDCVTTRAPAAFSLMTSAPILSVYCTPLPNRRFRLHVEPVEGFNPTGDRENDVQRLTQLCNDSVEHYIREQPENYFWFHKRWKHRPPDAPEVYGRK